MASDNVPMWRGYKVASVVGALVVTVTLLVWVFDMKQSNKTSAATPSKESPVATASGGPQEVVEGPFTYRSWERTLPTRESVTAQEKLERRRTYDDPGWKKREIFKNLKGTTVYEMETSLSKKRKRKGQ